MKASETIGKLTAAVAAASAAFAEWRKTGSAEVTMRAGGKFKYSYGELPELTESLRPALAAQGVWVFQSPEVSEAGDLVLVTRVSHSSGEWIETTIRMPAAKNASAQDLGSAITYMRRYVLQSLLLVAAGDDDGAAASQRPPQRQAANRPPKAPQASAPDSKPRAEARPYVHKGAVVPGLTTRNGKAWATWATFKGWLDRYGPGANTYMAFRQSTGRSEIPVDNEFHVGGAWVKLLNADRAEFDEWHASNKGSE